MIKAEFFRKEADRIVSFEMSGHADFAESGSDIVCAAASVLAMNVVNSIEELAGYQPIVDIDDGYLFVEILSDLSDKQIEITDILMNSLYIGLRDIEKEYNIYIRVK
ncbi:MULTISPECIES: ribosomal-processing cysteine protease Prp [Vagococcus]|uniref:Ribosomal processing cysteine protease Prp n=1 Tax=Vagococcus fluvialis bH819 TaxID=1255619 RepID=A0A1X6WMA5_9ENTE|nr:MULTISPECIES: ribosomal-processing cysteine protease Prp [Vagococcus]SLM85397.1 Potential ribosomal protein [Vagococcus fluvialis bH819]HCM89309.1 ribosomal-processing cysteine protease Prp [Vagococcus sp.]